MTDILVKPQELRQAAEQLRASAKKISGATGNVAIIFLSSAFKMLFSGNRSMAILMRFMSRSGEIASFDDSVVKFADVLEQAASRFEQADQIYNNNADGSSQYNQVDLSSEQEKNFYEWLEVLSKSTAWKQIIDQLSRNGFAIRLPDGTIVGSSDKNARIIDIVFIQGEGIPHYDFPNGKIVISEDFLNGNSSLEFNRTFIHELEHVSQHADGTLPDINQNAIQQATESLENKQELERMLTQMLYCEQSAYGKSILVLYELYGSNFSPVDPQVIFDGGYKAVYEEHLDKYLPDGVTAKIFFDGNTISVEFE